MLNRNTYHSKGTGNGVAIVMDTHGIGDDIMLLHALRELVKREKVTVFCKEFTKEIFQNVGCEVYPSMLNGCKTILSGLY
ncbi:hypothetical protein LAJ55_14190, partial [Streptococcus pneumoniae]|uniref:hypothetical protein n=1 Tax=Streptococcus pneumoniae TaxID=1313 RepID=UPI001CBB7CCB